MSKNVAVEIVRNERVESTHIGSMCIVDASGMVLSSFGDIDQKPYAYEATHYGTVLDLIESGAAEAFQLDHKDIAFLMSSQKSHKKQYDLAINLLKKVAIDQDILLSAFKTSEEALFNKQIGHHIALLILAKHKNYDLKNYIDYAHGIQADKRKMLEELIGSKHNQETGSKDNTGLPIYATPLKSLAYAYARMATGSAMLKERSLALKQIMKASQTHANIAATEKSFEADLMNQLKSQAYIKKAGEGLFVAALPHQGLGIALKVQDGSERASQCMMGYILEIVLSLSGTDRKALQEHLYPTIKTTKGERIGEIIPSDDFIRSVAHLRLMLAA